MCDFPNPKPAALTWMIDRVRGNEEANSVEVTCESYTSETEFEAEFLSLNSGRWVGECDAGDCFVESKPVEHGGGCSPRLASSSTTISQRFSNNVNDISDAGRSDAGVDSGAADGSLASDAGVSTDANTANDGAAVNVDAAGQTDGAQANADMSVAADVGVIADAASVEPDVAIVPPPLLDLESITFGIDPGADNCFALDPQQTSACLDVQSVQAFDVSRLFRAEGQPEPAAIDGVQFALDANHNIPRNISTINRADRHRFTRLIPIDVASEDATWAIEVHDEFPQNPEDNTIEVLGNMSASLEHCVNGDCSQNSYTLHISISSNINGALALCSWQYPKPEGSPCLR